MSLLPGFYSDTIELPPHDPLPTGQIDLHTEQGRQKATEVLRRINVSRLPWPVLLSVEDVVVSSNQRSAFGVTCWMTVSQRYSPGERLQLSHPRVIPDVLTVGALLEHARTAIHQLIVHEVDELLRVDGQHRWDPHSLNYTAPRVEITEEDYR